MTFFKKIILASFAFSFLWTAQISAVETREFERICKSGSLREAEELLKTVSADVELQGGNRLIHIAAEHASNPEIIKLLIKRKASVSSIGLEGRTPLMLAAAYNPNEAVTETLISSVVSLDSPDYDGRTPLHLAASINSSEKPLAVLLRHLSLP